MLYKLFRKKILLGYFLVSLFVLPISPVFAESFASSFYKNYIWKFYDDYTSELAYLFFTPTDSTSSPQATSGQTAAVITTQTPSVSSIDLLNTFRAYVKPIQPPNLIPRLPLGGEGAPSPIQERVRGEVVTSIPGPRGPQGIPGPQGPQGIQGIPGLTITSGGSRGVDSSLFVLKSFLSSQVERIYDSLGDSISGLADDLEEEISTGSLTVSGNTTIGGDLTVTGDIIGNVVGVINPSFTLGSVPFQGASGLDEDNANLFFNNTTNILSAGGFSGSLTGNVTGNLTGNVNGLTFAGTGGSTLTIGTGGTLSTAAYTASTDYASADLVINAGTGGQFAFYDGDGTTLSGSSLITTDVALDNYFFGEGAGISNTSGSLNVFIGNNSGTSNTSGFYNTFIGSDSGYSNTTGENNNFFGTAGTSNTEGSGNNFFGINAGLTNITGNFNTLFGTNADVLSDGLTNATAIGYNAKVGASNSLVLGGTGGDAVNVGIGVTSPTARLSVLGDSSFNGNVSNILNADSVIEVVGTVGVGNTPYSVAVSGKYAYVANQGDNNISVVDISDPLAPEQISTAAVGETPYSIAIAGRYAYVANYFADTISIVDIADPSNPIEISTAAVGSFPFAITVSGSYAYVTNSSGDSISIVDISNPSNPTQVSTIGVGIQPIPVAVSGRYAYVGNQSDGTVSIVDVSDPLNPSIVGSPLTVGSFPYSISISGRYAYVANNDDNNISIIDISDPALPLEILTADVGVSPTSVTVSGRYAYVANSGDSTLSIVDLTGIETTSLIAGQADIGNLSIRNNLGVSGEADIFGGLTVGGSASVQGDLSVGRTLNLADISVPGDTTNALYNIDGSLFWNGSEMISSQWTTVGNDIRYALGDVTIGSSSTVTPVEVGSVATGANPKSVAVSGDYSYVVNQDVGTMQVFDISDPSLPVQVGTDYTTAGSPTSISISGNYAYLVGGISTFLEVVNISDPANPAQAATLDLSETLISITVSGNYAYVVTAGNNLKIIDISSPTNPTEVIGGTVSTTSTSPTDVVVRGNYAYVTEASLFEVFDVSDPAAPVSFGSTVAGIVDPESLALAGQYAYLADHDSTAIIRVDISDPANPTTLTDSTTGTSPNSIAILGDYAYITNDTDNTIQTFDISDPDVDPLEVGIPVATGEGPTHIEISGRYAYVTNGTGNTLQIFKIKSDGSLTVAKDVSVGGNLSVLGGEPVLKWTQTTGTNPTSVTVSGNYAYVVNYTSNTLQVFDISDPSSIVQVGSDVDTGTIPMSIAVSSGYAYVVNYTSNTLQIFDISDPTSVVQVGSDVTTGTNPLSIAVSGRYAYVVNTTSGTLQIFDISDPTSVTQVGTDVTTGTNPMSVAVSGRYAYVVNTTSGTLQIFDISDPTSVIQVGDDITTGTNPVSVAVSGRYVYVGTNGDDKMEIFDMIDPNNPTSIANVSIGNFGNDGDRKIAISGRYAYVVNNDSDTLQIFDISDPDSISQVGSDVTTGDYPISITVSGRYAYVVNHISNSFQIFDLGGTETTNLNVRNNTTIEGNASVGQNLTVTGNIFTNSSMSFFDQNNLGNQANIGWNIFSSSGFMVDSTANANNGTCNAVSGTCPLHADGVMTGAATFDGTDDGITVSDDASLHLTDNFTLMAWVKMNSPSGQTYGIIGKPDLASEYTVEYGNYAVDTFSFSSASYTGDNPTTSLNTLVTDELWHQVIWTYDGTTIKGYLDGTEDVSTDKSFVMTPGSDQVIIGKSSYTLNGSLDEVAIWNRAITADEITDLYNGGLGAEMVGNENGLQALYHLNSDEFGVDSDFRIGGNLNLDGNLYQNGSVIDLVGPWTSTTNDSNVDLSYTGGSVSNLIGADSVSEISTVAVGTNPYSVAVSGKYAYVANSGTNNISVVDISDPANPEEISTASVGTGPFSIATSGRYVYTANSGSDNISIVNISDPKNPVEVSTVSVGDNPQSIAVSGKYAYVANLNDDTISVVNISDPANPVVVGSPIAVGNDPIYIAVYGRYAYVTNFNGGISSTLSIVDISDPLNPSEVGTVSTQSGSRSVAVSGRNAYVANQSNDTVSVVDVSDSENPEEVSTVNVGSVPVSIWISGRYAYVANNNSDNISIVDISDPINPVQISTADVGVNPQSITASGRYAYVTNYSDNTLSIVDLTGIETTSLTAGSADIGNLSIRNNLGVSGEADVFGGLTVGGNGLINGNFAVSGTTDLLSGLDVTGLGKFTGAATSTITGTADPDGTTTLAGTSTLFTTELVVGDRITVNAETRTVVTITSNTSLNVDTAFIDTAAGASIDKLPAIFIALLSDESFAMVINDIGNVGIGVVSPEYKLDIDGTGRWSGLSANGGANYTLCLDSTTEEILVDVGVDCSGSSERFKHDIGDLGISGLDILLALKPSSFTYNNQDSKINYGFIAEEAGDADSHLITYEKDGVTPHGLDTNAFLAIIIKAMQEQQVRIGSELGVFDRVETKTLCIGETCVTEDDLKGLLENAGTTPPDEPEPEPTSPQPSPGIGEGEENPTTPPDEPEPVITTPPEGTPPPEGGEEDSTPASVEEGAGSPAGEAEGGNSEPEP